jgi:site-specific recombinase XerD
MTRELVPAGRRELARGHIAFYRAVLDGIDLAKAWDLYLSADGDYTPALGAATTEWVRQALIYEAMATGQPGLIGLLRREPWRVKTSTKPTLEEFAERLADAGEWSEAELTEMWKDEYGQPDKAEARRDRLSKRLREALLLLERAPRRTPFGADAVATWLAPNLAANLMAAGLTNLQEVRDALAARTTPRWEAVPGVGEVWADRLLAWFTEYGIEPSPPPPPLPSPVELPVQLVPLERIEVPLAAVSDVTLLPPAPAAVGTFVQAENRLGATDDRHAIELWLAAKATNPNTQRSYRKCAERFLLWCIYERRIGFADVTSAECIQYREWLTSLGRKTPEEWDLAGWHLPADRWIGPRAPRLSDAWKPFEGPLKADSVAYDLLTVRALFAHLVKGRYLRDNAWDLMGKKMVARSKLATATEQFRTRSFTLDQWKIVIDGLDPHGPELERRLLLVLWLGFACGLRATEMLTLTLGSLDVRHEPWRMRVLGKGDKVRTVPLPSPARQVLLSYLDCIGVSYERVVAAALGDDQAPEAQHSILRGRRGRRPRTGGALPMGPLHYTQLYDALKAHLKKRASDLEREDPIAGAKLRKSSTHWLRHTCATLALKNGVALNSVQKLLGHTDLNTTSAYVTEHDEVLASEMEAFVGKTM